MLVLFKDDAVRKLIWAIFYFKGRQRTETLNVRIRQQWFEVQWWG